MIEYAKFLALFLVACIFYIIKNYFSNILLTCLNLRERERAHNMFIYQSKFPWFKNLI
jgi:hypothetical protein